MSAVFDKVLVIVIDRLLRDLSMVTRTTDRTAAQRSRL